MGIFDLPPRTLTLIGFLIGFTLIDDLTAAQQNSLGNFFMLIGQTLEANSGQQAVLNAKQSQKETEDMKRRLEQLERKLF